jgi:hypothetical protein
VAAEEADVTWDAPVAVATGELGVSICELGVAPGELDVAAAVDGLAAGAHASTAVSRIAPSTTSGSCLKERSPYDVNSDDRGDYGLLN